MMAANASLEAEARPKPTEGEGVHVWNLAATVLDPEVPVLTIEDLGVLRSAEMVDGRAVVTITPTYSGCPAMDVMREDVLTVLHDAGYEDAEVKLVLAPAWTTDWMSEEGKAKLEKFGIAPPTGHAAMAGRGGGPVRVAMSVKCPQCGSLDTTESSRFGSTACKAQYTCNACHEPFDFFKVI